MKEEQILVEALDESERQLIAILSLRRRKQVLLQAARLAAQTDDFDTIFEEVLAKHRDLMVP